MPVWLSIVPTVFSAAIQLARLIYDLAKERNKDTIKECALEIENARLSGDTTKLIELINKAKRGGPC